MHRAEEFIREIDDNISLFGEEWEVWSGKLNRRLRNAIATSSGESKKKLKLAFDYWQTQNEMKRLNTETTFDKKESLLNDINSLLKETFGERQGIDKN